MKTASNPTTQKPRRVLPPLVLENARIFYRNFSGKPSSFNASGNRNFALEISDELAIALAADEWNVKTTKPPKDDPDGPVRKYVSVKVGFDKYPPQITMISSVSGRQVLLTEETISLLDTAEILNVDVIVRPYPWTQPSGDHGTKGYVQVMYVTVLENQFAAKYAKP
jgi:hypothetical protein